MVVSSKGRENEMPEQPFLEVRVFQVGGGYDLAKLWAIRTDRFGVLQAFVTYYGRDMNSWVPWSRVVPAYGVDLDGVTHPTNAPLASR